MNCILSQTFFTKELIYNLTLEIYASFPMGVCYFYLLPDIVIEWIEFFQKT